MRFIPCLNTQTIYSETLPNKIKHAAMAGFTAIELWIDEIDAFCTGGNRLSDVRRMLEDHGLRCLSTIKIDGWSENDGSIMNVADDHDAIMAECERRMVIARELGSPYIIACPSYSHRGYPTPAITQVVAHWRELLELGERIGVVPTVEFLGQSHQINTIEKCIDLIERTCHPQAKMVVDSYHLWRGGGKSTDLAKAHPGIISMLHINDMNPAIDRIIHRDRDRLMPGDGGLDLDSFIRIADEIGYNGVVSLGVYNRALWERDSLEVCREGYQKTMRVIRAALGQLSAAEIR